MIRKNHRFQCNLFSVSSGMTLTEIVLAMAILAAAFIPIMGVLGSSVKGTLKDERTIKAVHLAQATLNAALQFPFGELLNKYGSPISGGLASATITSASGSLQLQVGGIMRGGTKYQVSLEITDEPLQFQVMTYDPIAKGDNPTVPANWGWTNQNLPSVPLSNVYHKYKVKITWAGQGAVSKFYDLVAYKARISEH